MTAPGAVEALHLAIASAKRNSRSDGGSCHCHSAHHLLGPLYSPYPESSGAIEASGLDLDQRASCAARPTCLIDHSRVHYSQGKRGTPAAQAL
jgi:hypothetical protein